MTLTKLPQVSTALDAFLCGSRQFCVRAKPKNCLIQLYLRPGVRYPPRDPCGLSNPAYGKRPFVSWASCPVCMKTMYCRSAMPCVPELLWAKSAPLPADKTDRHIHQFVRGHLPCQSNAGQYPMQQVDQSLLCPSGKHTPSISLT